MADLDITVSDDGGELDLDEASAHEAAVAQGAAEAHAVQAEGHAEAADEAAELATAAATATADLTTEAEQAAVTAQDAATQAEITAQAMLATLQAQQAAIEALTEEIRAGRTPAPEPEQEVAQTPDTEPTPRRRHWYYGSR